MSQRSRETSCDLDFDSWLQQRASNPSFLMIELGHGLYSAAANQSFAGSRAYIGLETYAGWPSFWVKTARGIVDDLKKQRPDENLFFLKQPFNPDNKGANPTIIPDGVANETLLSNVLTSPDVRDAAGVLREAARMTMHHGNVVIRETFTPHDFVIMPAIQETGMQIVGESFYGDANWAALEEIYCSAGVNEDFSMSPSPSSFYRILQPTE